MASDHFNFVIHESGSENDATASRSPHREPCEYARPIPEAPPSEPFEEWSVGETDPWLIYTVPHRLREVNEKAYEPTAVSIGPYHYGKKHLRAMEDFKRSCFNKIIEKTNICRETFLEAMRDLQERVKKCYEELSCQDGDRFVEMMVLDGCFIVQLIRKIIPLKDLNNPGRPFQTDIRYDLLLLENQLPFFVLLKLDCMIMQMRNGGRDGEFARLALSFFEKWVQGPKVWPESENYPPLEKDIKHLLDLVHNSYRPSPQGIEKHNSFQAEGKILNSRRSWKFIRSAMELAEAGINFFGVKVQDHNQNEMLESRFDIVFTKDTKVLKIPTLYVHDNTERFFRNFMAYEQFIPSGKPTYFSDYVVFLDNLINTGKDVQLLCNSGIIDNWLGDDEAVAQMFNKLRDSIYLSESDDFYYAEIFCRVNEHCQKKWNKWKATLKRDYFNSPWSFISFLAAVFLLLFTLLQTIFSVLSYVQQ